MCLLLLLRLRLRLAAVAAVGVVGVGAVAGIAVLVAAPPVLLLFNPSSKLGHKRNHTVAVVLIYFCEGLFDCGCFCGTEVLF